MFRLTAVCMMLLATSRASAQINVAAAQPSSSPPAITLEDAIRLAKANAPDFRTAMVDAGIAHEDRVQARAALLPGVSYTTGAIYTKPNGTDTGAFIGANGPREYLSQGVVHEGLNFTSLADYSRAKAMEAVARARAEVAARGLVTTVVRDYYAVIVSQRKFDNARSAANEAQAFVRLSQQLENGGEVAHSDVVKAQLQANDRERDVQEAQLAAEQAKLGLAVLVFPNFTADYQVVNDLEQATALPDFTRLQELAARNNPEIAAASAAMQASQHEVSAAIGGHLPSLSFEYLYGIDASTYATNRPDGLRNLGYQAVATLNLPIFDWGATQSKVKQAQLRRDLAQVQLSSAQRTAVANLHLFYNEARIALGQLALLKQSVDLAAQSLHLTTIRYQAGEATALEVVDAQNAFLLAQNNYSDAAARYKVAIANLQTLTGSF